MKKTTLPVVPVPAPPLTTTRLLLRPCRQSDLADFHALRTQIEVMKWTSSGKNDADHATTQAWMNRFLPPNDATTLNFAVEELANPGKVIGILGCHKLNTLEPPEIGYMFRKESWGKGYATEALQRWLQVWWELPRQEVVIEREASTVERSESGSVVPEVLRACTDAENVTSARVLAKVGFRPVLEETCDINGAPIKVVWLEMERPR